MNNIDILEELKEWFNNFDLDSIKHKPEEYIQAISTIIAENKELKERNKRQQENLKIANKKIAAQRGQLMMLNKAYIPKSKLKAKIEEVEQWGLYNMKIPKLSTLDERLGAKIGIKYVLQSLLEKE